jgi:AraC-like DNA-binding protein
LEQLSASMVLDRSKQQHRQRAILIYLLASMHALDAPTSPAGLSASRQQQLRQWLRSHIAHHPTASDLAQVVGLSLHYFRQQFQTSFQCSPREWIRQERLHFAADLLLDSDESVQDIAWHCGYQSVSSFSRLFRQQFQVSPRQWRQQAQPKVRL